MVNWCPHCCTSISDAEVEYKEQNGHFWHLLYQVKETGEYLEIATTRPETMLGDTAVAVNKDDERYKHLHGCHVILPLLNKEIPIVCDEHADMEKERVLLKSLLHTILTTLKSVSVAIFRLSVALHMTVTLQVQRMLKNTTN